MPNTTIDFWQVNTADPNYQGTVEDLLTTIEEKPLGERLAGTKAGWTHFHRVTMRKKSIIGDVLNVRADQLPAAADREGTIEDLELAKDQGIAAVTYFYYRRANRILLTLRAPGALSGPGLERLIKELTGIQVEILPIAQPELIKRMKRLRAIRKIEIKLALPDPEARFDGGESITGMFDMMSQFNANVAEIKLSVGRRRKARLDRAKALGVMDHLHRLSRDGKEVKKAKVRGYDPVEERTVALDLLRGRMTASAEVSVGANRRLDDGSCLGALQTAYTDNSNELEDIYGG